MYENALSEPGNRKKHGAGENENHQHAALRKGYFFCKLYYSHPHHFSLLLILFFRFLLDAIIMHLVSVIINARSSKIIGFHFISDSNVLENYTRPNCSLRVPTSFQGEELSCNTTMQYCLQQQWTKLSAFLFINGHYLIIPIKRLTHLITH